MSFPMSRQPTREAADLVPATADAPARLHFANAPTQDSAYRSNWYQLGYDHPSTIDAMRSSAVYGCWSIISQEVARLHLGHYRTTEEEGRVPILSSGPAMSLRKPNYFQSRSDFWLYMVMWLLANGNAYAVRQPAAGPNRKRELIPVASTAVVPNVVETTGEIFYGLSPNPIMAQQPTIMVPQRDVLHLRLFCPNHPLIGVTPLMACAYGVEQGQAIMRQSTKFFERGARPSGVLTTPEKLGEVQAKRLGEQWERGMSGEHVGRTAVLDWGVTWAPMGMTAVEAAIVDQMGMTVEDIARCFRIPLYMLGRYENMPFRSVETLQRNLVASVLGFYLEHFEAALDDFYELTDRPTEHVEFDVERGMVRAETETRINAATKAVQGGVMTPDEARSREGLPPEPGGDKLYLQRQMVPLDVPRAGTSGVAEPDDAAEPSDEPTAAAAGSSPGRRGGALPSTPAAILAAAWRGTWRADATYAPGELVVANGSAWIHVPGELEGPPGKPGSCDSWQLFAQRGSRGARGGRDG